MVGVLGHIGQFGRQTTPTLGRRDFAAALGLGTLENKSGLSRFCGQGTRDVGMLVIYNCLYIYKHPI